MVFSFVILFIPHTTGSCPESTDQTPAVVALSAVLVIVVLLLAPSHYWLVVHQWVCDVRVCASMCKYVSTYVHVNVCLKGMTLSDYKLMCMTDVHCTFITAGPSDYSDNDAAHHISVAAMSLNATGKCNIICSSYLVQHAISTQSNVHNLACCIYIGTHYVHTLLHIVCT